jgi:hypothetical protein
MALPFLFSLRARAAVLALAAVAVTGAIAGCSSLQTKPVPEITYAHESPITLGVREIAIDSAYASPGEPPHQEQQFETTPEAVLKRWAQERLRAAGVANTARFTVLNAPVTVEPLPKTKGFLGAFRIEPEKKYTITLEGQLEILDDTGQRLRLASARVTRSRQLEEGATPEQRQVFEAELTQSAMDTFNAEMERSIQQYLAPWVL